MMRIETPALCLQEKRLDANIDHLLAIAGDSKRLWPHIKTYKTSRLVMRLQARGVRAFKCATRSEARLLGRCGVRDALLAYPPTGASVDAFVRDSARYRNTRFSCLVEDAPRLHEIETSAETAGVIIGIFVDIDTGQGRTGTGDVSLISELADFARASSSLEFRGLHLYDGQNHQSDPEERATAARTCVEFAEKLRSSISIEFGELFIAGGTPTFPYYAQSTGYALSPGTAIIFDAGYARLFPDLPFQPAAWVLSTVVSVQSDRRITVDAGTKAIATDPAGARGKFTNADVAETLIHNEEHWVVRLKPGNEIPKVGDQIRIVPTHVCPTFNLYNELHLVDETGNPKDRWAIDGRDRTLGPG